MTNDNNNAILLIQKKILKGKQFNLHQTNLAFKVMSRQQDRKGNQAQRQVCGMEINMVWQSLPGHIKDNLWRS